MTAIAERSGPGIFPGYANCRVGDAGVGLNVDVELGEDDVGLLRCPQTDQLLRFDGKFRAHLVGAGRIRLDQQDQDLPATGSEIDAGLSGDLIDDVGAFDKFAGFELEKNARRSFLAILDARGSLVCPG